METRPIDAISTTHRFDKEVIPTVSAGSVPIMPAQVRLEDRSWPFLGSCTLHALFFALISTSDFHYPIVIDSTTPSIVWVSPLQPPADSSEPDRPQHNPPAPPAAAEEKQEHGAISQETTATTVTAARPDLPEESAETATATAEAEIIVAAPPPVKITTEPTKSGRVTEPPLSATTPTAPEPARNARVSLEKKPGRAPVIAAIQPAVARNVEPSPAKKADAPPIPVKPAEKPQSVNLSLIRGDIKLVMVGSKQPVIKIAFTEFAQSRRDRPLSRAESRRSTPISPVIAQSGDMTREIVIARAGHGIYTITAESPSEPAHVAVTLKLHEGGARPVSRESGATTISSPKVLYKILMPEGIIWDDNSFFTGNLEDSEGVTRFNAETGLMWKEYSE